MNDIMRQVKEFTPHKRSRATVTLLCDNLRERVCEWRHQRDANGARKGVFATFRDRVNGARFVELFPAYAGQTITLTYGVGCAMAPDVATWLVQNGYLQPRNPQALWR